MKRIAVVIIIILSVSFLTLAKKPYSVENLGKLSQEELDIYYNKALKHQKTGKTLTIVGACAVGGSLLTIPLDATGGMVAASAIFLVGIPGLATTIVGFSMNSTNKKRVELINSLRNTAFNDIQVNFQPCTQYNLMTQKYQPGFSLRINF